MLRVAFLIRSLEAGGAERQLAVLATGLARAGGAVTVVTFADGGALEAELARAPGVVLVSARRGGWLSLPGFFWRLLRVVRAARPDVIHGYMPGANELALACGRLTRARVVWGLRASDVELAHYGLLSRVLFHAGRWLSPLPDLIIANSEAGRRHHAARGYDTGRAIVIPNGIDVVRFRPDPEARSRLRREWGIAADALVVGIVARLDPMTDHDTFLRAAAIVAARLPAACFVAAGSGAADYRRRLEARAADLGLQGRVRWLGRYDDPPALYNALDVMVSASAFGEGFSNALGEAMASGVPCVATDVGDSAVIVADTGRVVPRRRPDLLAGAMIDLAGADRSALGRRARERIEQQFSARALIDRTRAALSALVAPARSTADHVQA